MGFSGRESAASVSNSNWTRLLVAVASMLAFLALVGALFGVSNALAASDMPTKSGAFEVVIQMDGAGSGTNNPGADSGATITQAIAGNPVVVALLPRTGDPLSWVPTALLAVAAVAAASLAWRRARAITFSAQAGAHADITQAASSSRFGRASDTNRAGALRNLVLPSALAVLLAIGAISLPVMAQAESTVQQVIFKADAAGNVKQTKTVHLDNAETYRAFLSHAVITNENGWFVQSSPSRAGDVSIKFAPTSGVTGAVDAAPVADGWDAETPSDWTAPGTASKGDAGIDLEVTVEAKGATSGTTGVAMFSYDLQAQPYEGTKAEVTYSGDLVLGVPVKAEVSGLPSDGDNTLTYRWQSSEDGEDWVDIPGEVDDTLVPGVELAFRKVRVVVDCSNPAWYIVPGDASEATVEVYAETATLTLVDTKSSAGSVEQTVVVGSTAPDPVAPTATGYTFEGWFTGEGVEWNFGTDTIRRDTTLTAKWTPNKNTPYTVKHLLATVSGSGYETVDVENLVGETDSQVTPTVRSYPGFVSPAEETVTILPDGSAEVDYRYERAVYTVSFAAVLPSEHDATGMPAGSMQVKYQDTLASASDPVIAGYDFIGWYTSESGGKAFSFGVDQIVGNTTLYARWVASGDTPYKVEHYQQNVAGTDYALAETVELHGTTDSNVNAEFKDYTGFQHVSIGASVESGTVVSAGTLVLKVYYDRTIGTVSYKTNHGEQPDAVQRAYGAEVPLPALSAEGYTFGGWYSDEDCMVPWTGAMPAGDVTLHAKWTVNTHTLHFDVSGRGNAPADQRVDYGETATEPDEPMATGYTFEGWYETANYSGAVYDFSTPMPDRDVTLYAKWSPRVKFLPGTDDEVTGMPEPDEITVARGSIVAQPAAPSRTGYTFAGWYDESGTKWNFGTAVQANVTLTARWVPNKYTVTFNKGEGTVTGSTADQVMTYDQSANLTANGYTRAGYVFDGWKGQNNETYTDKQSVKNLISDAKGTFEMTAQWKEGVAGYTVYHYRQLLDGNMPKEGSKEDSYRVVDVDTEYRTAQTGETVNVTPKSGGDYAGFTPNESISTLQGVVKGDGSLELHVYYKRNTDTQYTIKRQYQNADGTWGTEVEDSQKAKGTTGALATFDANTGAEYQEPTVTYSPASGAILGDGSTVVTLKYARKSNTVDFDANGHGTAPASQSVLYGATAKNPGDLTATGWTFHNWYEQANLESGSAYDFTTAVTAYLKLYAKWSANQYTINFEPGDGATVDPTSVTKTYGTNLESLPTPTREGYTFAGWFTEEGGTGSRVTESSELSATAGDVVTAYAKWTADTGTTYTVRFWQQDLNEEKTAVANTYTEMGADERSVSKGNAPTGTTNTSTGNWATTEASKYTGFHPTNNEELAAKAESTIAGNGSTVIDVYYDRDTDVAYEIKYYEQALNAEGTAVVGSDVDVASNYAAVKTVSGTGITGQAISVATDAPDDLDITGFTAKSDGNVLSGTISASETTALKVYYDRNTYKYAVTHSKQKLNDAGTAATNEYAEVEDDKAEIEAPYGAKAQADLKSYDGFTAQTVAQQTVPANNDLVVDVKYNRNTFTVTFSPNRLSAFSSNAPAAQNVPYGGRVVKPSSSPGAVGGLFVDWYKDSDLTNEWAFDTETVTSAVTIYARWCNIKFDANGGEGTMEPMFSTASTDKLTKNTFTNAAYNNEYNGITYGGFIGWNTKKDGSGRWIFDEGEVENLLNRTYSGAYAPSDGVTNGTVILYAQWSHLTGMPVSVLKDVSAQVKSGSGDMWHQYWEYANAGDLWIPDGDLGVDTGFAADKKMLCRLISVARDEDANGAKIGLTFTTARPLPLMYAAGATKNGKYGNYGGWAKSDMKNTLNSETFYGKLPSGLSVSNVVPAKKTSLIGEGSSSTTTNAYTFWTLSLTEITGSTELGGAEGSISPYHYYYTNNGSSKGTSLTSKIWSDFINCNSMQYGASSNRQTVLRSPASANFDGSSFAWRSQMMIRANNTENKVSGGWLPKNGDGTGGANLYMFALGFCI